MKSNYAVHAERMAGAILKALERSTDFLLFVHKNMDGDCIGSACGMAQVLRNMGFTAHVAVSEDLLYTMAFMGVEDLLIDVREADVSEISSDYVPFATDCSEARRMGDCGRFFDCGREALIIDHHVSVSLEGGNYWINGDASSACELCYYVSLALEEKTGRTLIDKRAAVCFLTGIVTDTGKFAYKNTKPETLTSAGELMERGANCTDICYNLFDRKTRNNYEAVTHLREKIEFFCDGKLVLLRAHREDFTLYGADDSAIDEMPSTLRDIDGVELSVVLREVEGRIRCNLRSKNDFNCSELAASFGGGGHLRASGFNLPSEEYTIEEVAELVVNKASEMF